MLRDPSKESFEAWGTNDNYETPFANRAGFSATGLLSESHSQEQFNLFKGPKVSAYTHRRLESINISQVKFSNPKQVSRDMGATTAKKSGSGRKPAWLRT